MNITGTVLANQFDADVTYGAKPTSRKIVHIGATSRFFRAHWADYISDLLETDPRWGITAIALGHSTDSVSKLQNLSSRGGAYGLMARGAGAPSYKIINAVVDNIHAPGRYDEVLMEMADPEVEIFSMTITDPGYCRNRDSKTPVLDHNDAQIIHDLADLKATNNDPSITAQPKSAIGLLVAGMRERMRSNSGGVTVLALDNLEGNGAITNALVQEMARDVDPMLAQWINANVAFSNTAVDRITPMATDDFNDAAAQKFGNAFPVIGTEVPRELAIEDNHRAGFPDLGKVGVIMTHDPKAFFERKFRLLNRGHTVVATLAQRIGQIDGQPIDTIDKAIEIPEVKTFFKTLLASEVKQALPEATKNNVDAYIDEVISRFGNIILQDQVTRVGGEGQRKIPKYVFSGIEQAMEHNLPYEGLVLTAATWVFSASDGLDQNGQRINMNDPNLRKVGPAAVDIKAAATAAVDYRSAVEGVKIVLNRHDFWKPFDGNEDFARAMAYYIRQINNNDLRSVLADYNKAREVGTKPVPHVS